jgi:GT2 family glycosyltransferase
MEALGACTIELPDRTPVSNARNIGAANARGELLMFLDDDNIVSPDTIEKLSAALTSWPDAVLVGPAMYYQSIPERLWCAGVHRTRVLMQTRFVTAFPRPLPNRIPSDDFPNCFMVAHKDFDRVDGFDEIRFPVHYEEADLARRLVHATHRAVYCVPSARVWHDINSSMARRLHLKDPETAYWIGRNRAQFTTLYGNRLQRVAYFILGQWVFAAFYLLATATAPRGERRGVARGYVRGLLRGILAQLRSTARG